MPRLFASGSGPRHRLPWRPFYAGVVGSALRALRQQREMAQSTLAERAGLSSSSMSRFEAGQSLPDMYELHAIARVLKMEPAAIYNLVDRAIDRTKIAAKALKVAFERSHYLAIGAIAELLKETDATHHP